MSSQYRRRRHPNGRVVAFIWVGLIVVAFVCAILFQDDDPRTDDGAAWGALAGLAGGAVTAVYVVVSVLLDSRRRRMEAAAEAPVAGSARRRPSVARVVLVATGLVVALLVALTIVGGVAVWIESLGSEEESPPGETVAAVIAAVMTASPGVRIESVDCTSRRVSGVHNCAVTLEGPACQIWQVGKDGTPVATEPPIEGMRGSATDTGAACAA